MKNNLKFVQSILFAAIVICVFVPAITIFAELFAPLKAWLKSVFFHHWVGKGILTTIIFIGTSSVVYFLPIKAESEKLSRLLIVLCVSAFTAAAVIVGFFSYEFYFG